MSTVHRLTVQCDGCPVSVHVEERGAPPGARSFRAELQRLGWTSRAEPRERGDLRASWVRRDYCPACSERTPSRRRGEL